MRWLSICLLLLFCSPCFAVTDEIKVGSKKFTEGVTLGELIRLTLNQDDIKAVHKQELGGTRIVWNALLSGDIDMYVDYTGTITEEILRERVDDFGAIRTKLEKLGIGTLDPFGFNNTYAIGMKQEVAQRFGIETISDLARHPELKIGFGDEFRQRRDGWPGLKENYRLPHKFVRGLDHDIAYRALETNDIQVTDLYSTDAEISYYDLRILRDDKNFFPSYKAFILYRLEIARERPEVIGSLQKLVGAIDNETMIEMNKRAKVERIPSSQVASDFLNNKFDLKIEYKIASRPERMWVRTQEHISLVVISLLLAILVGIPLGITSAKLPLVGKFVLGIVGVIQTIPALALLVILIHPLGAIGLSGIGDTPALIALFLYSLLPIVRSTHVGIEQIPMQLKETADVLGLSKRTKLRKIELPLALPTILSGIKTSAVLNVGFATLGALVGAGGFGQPILTGIRLDDYGLILEGALPAAALALVVQSFFDKIDSVLVSPGLRSRS